MLIWKRSYEYKELPLECTLWTEMGKETFVFFEYKNNRNKLENECFPFIHKGYSCYQLSTDKQNSLSYLLEPKPVLYYDLT